MGNDKGNEGTSELNEETDINHYSGDQEITMGIDPEGKMG